MTEDLNQDLAVMRMLTEDEGEIGDDFWQMAQDIAALNNNRNAGMIDKSIKAISAGVPKMMKGMRNFMRRNKEDEDNNDNVSESA